MELPIRSQREINGPYYLLLLPSKFSCITGRYHKTAYIDLSGAADNKQKDNSSHGRTFIWYKRDERGNTTKVQKFEARMYSCPRSKTLIVVISVINLLETEIFIRMG